MKFIILFAATLAVVLAAPLPEEATIVRSESNVDIDGFDFVYEISDGTKAEASGKLENPGAEDAHISIKGSFSFVADDGQTYTVNYIADENGFQPEGAHIPSTSKA